ncbi:Deoxyuridine 5'-triphosphate nucleotidohydrolase [Hibiscus syriacus]|uniref:dUTP diphosphatase n=1 Tax=Hibiscus syriacus TaxID=106335 RepID=A0A6A3CL27_HIBSY|nr:Deoxyuridine 5'-triphosphate nucleotidohydrolase [Hibiscus syriacus]
MAQINNSPEIKRHPKKSPNSVTMELMKLPKPSLSLRVKKLSEKRCCPQEDLLCCWIRSVKCNRHQSASQRKSAGSDLSISIPEGTYARVAPRSGLAWKHSIDVGAGVIDADYRGLLEFQVPQIDLPFSSRSDQKSIKHILLRIPYNIIFLMEPNHGVVPTQVPHTIQTWFLVVDTASSILVGSLPRENLLCRPFHITSTSQSPCTFA